MASVQMAANRAYDLVVAAIKQATKVVPVVVITGWATETILGEFAANESQPDAVLQKPVMSETMEECLRRFRNET